MRPYQRHAAVLLLITMLAATPTLATEYRFRPDQTSVRFSSLSGLVRLAGTINGARGTVTYEPGKPVDSAIHVTLDMATLSTGSALLDRKLKSHDYFDVEAFPTASFASRAVRIIGKSRASITGDLTLHGVTRPVILVVTFKTHDAARSDNGQMLSAVFQIRRSEFGITKSQFMAGDRINLCIDAALYP